jgi:hypothetical protein
MQLRPPFSRTLILRCIEHPTDKFFSIFDFSIDFVLADDLLILVDVVQVQFHYFPLKLSFLVVDFFHIRSHKLIDIQVFFSGTDGRGLLSR